MNDVVRMGWYVRVCAFQGHIMLATPLRFFLSPYLSPHTAPNLFAIDFIDSVRFPRILYLFFFLIQSDIPTNEFQPP